MSNNDRTSRVKVEQFREVSEADKGTAGRLVQDRQNRTRGDLKNIDLLPIQRVFHRTLRDASDIRNIFQTMPDLNLPREILVSAICSPGDLTKTTLIFGDEMPGVDTALTAPLNQRLEQFFVKDRKIDANVPEWVDDALIWSGAHPIMILPEASIDRMIQAGVSSASMESVASYGGEFSHGWFRPKGILGLRLPTAEGDKYASFESANGRVNADKMVDYHTIKAVSTKTKTTVPLPIRVTDNLAAFRMPAVQQAKRAGALKKAYGETSLESRRKQRQADLEKVRKAEGKDQERLPSNQEIYSKYFQRPQKTSRSRLVVVPTLKQSEGDNNGHPLEYHLATEAVMPVTVPGDPSNHVGYLVILDNNGFPVSFSRRLNFYDDIRRGAAGPGTGSNQQVSGEILQIAKETMNGNIADMSNIEIDRLADLNGQVIEADIIARFKSGLMGGDFELGRTEEIDRLMLARTYKNQLTTLLYVPAELMIYMAYDYNDNGIGKSILEDAKALAAMRAALTVANVIGATKNAIPGKDINIELDPDDGDPVGTATFMANEALGLAYHAFPMSISSTVGLAEQLQLSSMSVNVTGNPRFPEVKTTITPRESSKVEIDPELMKQLKDDMNRVFSLTSEMVDGVNSPDFAVTVVQNNLMLMKRVMMIQSKTNPMLTDYVRTFTWNSGPLVDELLDLISNNADKLPPEFKEDPEGFLEAYLNCITVKLPEPESDNLTKQLDVAKNFSDAVDQHLVHFIREEYFDGYSPDQIRDALPTVTAAWKGVIMREWLRKRGILRELDVFMSDEDGSPMVALEDDMKNHVAAVMKFLGGYATKVAKDAAKRKIELDQYMTADEKAKAIMELINANGENGDGTNTGTEEEPGSTDAGIEGTDDNFDANDMDALNTDDQNAPSEEEEQEEDETQKDETQEEPKPNEEEEEAPEPAEGVTPKVDEGTGGESADDFEIKF